MSLQKKYGNILKAPRIYIYIYIYMWLYVFVSVFACVFLRAKFKNTSYLFLPIRKIIFSILTLLSNLTAILLPDIVNESSPPRQVILQQMMDPWEVHKEKNHERKLFKYETLDKLGLRVVWWTRFDIENLLPFFGQSLDEFGHRGE